MNGCDIGPELLEFNRIMVVPNVMRKTLLVDVVIISCEVNAT